MAKSARLSISSSLASRPRTPGKAESILSMVSSRVCSWLRKSSAGCGAGSAVFSTDSKNIEPVDSNDRTQPINSTAYSRSIIDELTSKESNFLKLTSKIELLERKIYIRNAHALSEKESLIGDLEKFKKGIEKGIDESNKKIQDQDSKITNQSNKNIEILALFATFFTFISVNVQVFSNLKNLYQSLIFVFFFGLILIAFLMLF